MIPQEVQAILERLEAAGHQAYVVGGCVRDLLMGVTPHDWDITTSALPAETMALFPHFAIPTGLQHGTVTVRQGGKAEAFTVSTDVYFRPCTEEELRAYIATGEPMDKAGAYGVQSLGALLVERIDGDFYNVMGLPVEKLGQCLTKHFGVRFF